MKAFPTVATLLFAVAGAHAGEVYKTTDAQGRPVYTDKPPSLPAERLKVQSATTDVVEVQKRYDAQMKQYGAADEATAEAAKKAADARKAQEMTAEAPPVRTGHVRGRAPLPRQRGDRRGARQRQAVDGRTLRREVT